MNRHLQGLVLAAVVLALACDGGPWRLPQSWQRVYPSFAAPVHDLLRDPGDPRVIYAACGWQSVGDSRPVGGLLRSADHGERWVEANRGLLGAPEVLSLASLPAGLLAEGLAGPAQGPDTPVLLAGTRGAGLFASSDGAASWHRLPERRDGPKWDRLTLQGLAVLSGEEPVLAVGTKEYGVFFSEDGGRSWHPRNKGLLNLAIQELASDPTGRIYAGTWFGGIYWSDDLGESWQSLDAGYARAAVSTLAVTEDGTLWIGLQNAGLLATDPHGAPPLALELQGEEVIQEVGVLALAGVGDRVLVGTSGRGAVIGRRGGRFTVVDEGLDNTTVSAVLSAHGPSDRPVVGTWSGLYRGVPATTLRTPTILLTLGAIILLLTWLATSRHRSVSSASIVLFRELGKLEPHQVSRFLGEEVAKLPDEQTAFILEDLAIRLSRAKDDLRVDLGEIVALTAPLYRHWEEQRGGGGDRASRQALAQALDARAHTLEVAADRWWGRSVQGATNSSNVAAQERFFAKLLRADSLAHFAALRDDLEALERRLDRPGQAITTPRRGLSHDLRHILDVIDQLGRLPSAEDRALYLGQALTQTLAAQARLAGRHEKRPTFHSRLGAEVLESVRHLLATTLEDIHHRAELEIALHSNILTTQREAVVVLEIENVGQGHARNIIVELQPDEGFRSLRPRREVRSLLRNQSARLEFLVEPLVSDRVRLRFRIEYDDLERQGHRREFADVVEFRQISHHRTFQPLRPNPYVVGRPLAPGDVFIGRDELFERLEASLRGAQQDNVVVLMGPRRMGKTSILCRIRDHLGEDYLPVLIDLQGMIGSGESAFFRELAATLLDGLEELGIEIPEPSAELFDLDPGQAFRRKFLAGIRRQLGERRLLLLFDEFEVLEARIRSGDLQPRILPYFRSLVQHEKGISFLFAGTHRLDELTRDYWGVLFNLAIYLEVGHLPRQAVEQLFVAPTREHFEIDPLALDKAYQLTGGHPHFSQLLARELVELRNRQRLAYVTIQDLNQVAEQVAEKGQLHISYLWEDGSRTERLLLLALKEMLDRTGMATLSAAQKYLDQHHIPISDPATALRQLMRREIVDDNAGLLSFRMELLRLWLDRHHDIESFLLSNHDSQEA